MLTKSKDATNFTNQSSDMHVEKSHEERLEDARKVPIGPKKKRGRSKRQSMHTVNYARTQNPGDKGTLK